MKYSKKFERDYDFYLRNKNNFDFCGTFIPKFQVIYEETGKSAKEVFYSIDSEGKNTPCCEPELLTELLLCKGGVNFQIKLWSEGRGDGTLPGIEFKEIIEQYGCPEWVYNAVERQKEKIYEQKGIYNYFFRKDTYNIPNLKHSEDYRFF